MCNKLNDDYELIDELGKKVVFNPKYPGYKRWSLEKDGILWGDKLVFYADMIRIQNALPATAINPGTMTITLSNNKVIGLAYRKSDKVYFEKALKIMSSKYGPLALRNSLDKNLKREELRNKDAVYVLEGVRGRHMSVFEDRCILKVKVTAGSLLVGNATDGEKTIYYADCNGVQFKESALTIGYIQLETASGLMNNTKSNIFNENTFTFDLSVTTNEYMIEVHEYINSRISLVKNSKGIQVPQKSLAEELKELHELVQLGILTQEEFDEKKMSMLNN